MIPVNEYTMIELTEYKLGVYDEHDQLKEAGSFIHAVLEEDADNCSVYIMTDDSMEPFIKDGDTLLVMKKAKVQNHDYIIVNLMQREAICRKIIVHDNGSISLQALNFTYPSLYYLNKEHFKSEVKIIGRVQEIRRSL
jgi:phage repressor protein C with HTH and peptisase S24 domain